MGNVETLEAMYEAYGRGDVAAILDRLSDDVRWDVWDSASPVQEEIFYIRPRTGKESVEDFFSSLAGLEFHKFEIANILAGGAQVVALINLDITVKATGKRVQDLEVHLWTFGPDGKVTAFRHILDTAKSAAAQRI